jgi:hypothetical protein
VILFFFLVGCDVDGSLNETAMVDLAPYLEQIPVNCKVQLSVTPVEGEKVEKYHWFADYDGKYLLVREPVDFDIREGHPQRFDYVFQSDGNITYINIKLFRDPYMRTITFWNNGTVEKFPKVNDEQWIQIEESRLQVDCPHNGDLFI